MTKAGLLYAAGIALCASLFAPVAAGANAAAPVGVRHMELGGDRVRFTQVVEVVAARDAGRLHEILT